MRTERKIRKVRAQEKLGFAIFKKKICCTFLAPGFHESHRTTLHESFSKTLPDFRASFDRPDKMTILALGVYRFGGFETLGLETRWGQCEFITWRSEMGQIGGIIVLFRIGMGIMGKEN